VAASVFGTVSPKPVISNAEINVEWKKNEEGYYTFELTNKSGKHIIAQDFWMDDAEQVLNLPVPSICPGIYCLTITSKTSGEQLSMNVYL
jgi:hypothetical protein